MSRNDDADNPYEYMDLDDDAYQDYLFDRGEQLQSEYHRRVAIWEERNKNEAKVAARVNGKKQEFQNRRISQEQPTYFGLVVGVVLTIVLVYTAGSLFIRVMH